MDNQSLGRHKRPKWANIKQALQLMLLLAVCAWLLYQINQSRDKTQRFGGQIKIFEEYGVVLLGRKSTPSWLINQIALPDSGNVHFVAEAEYTTKDFSKEDFRKIHAKPSESGNPTMLMIRINDSEAQVREPLNDVQIREKAILDDSIDGVHSFHDENGVPPEGNIPSFTFGNENRLGEINIYEEVTSGEVNDAGINSETRAYADTSGII